MVNDYYRAVLTRLTTRAATHVPGLRSDPRKGCFRSGPAPRVLAMPYGERTASTRSL